MTNLSRAFALFFRSPVRSKTRSTASPTSKICSTGKNSWARNPARRSVERPPPMVTWNPRRPSRKRAKKPMSWKPPPTQSPPQQPPKAILNLRGRVDESGPRSRCRVIASAYGVTSKGSCPDTPAYGQPVMLRTELPHASRVVMPAAPRWRTTASTSSILMKWNCMFCRVVMCPFPFDQRSDTSASASSCSGVSTPCGILQRTIIGPSCRWPYTPCTSRKARQASGATSPRSNASSFSTKRSSSPSSANPSRVEPSACG